MPATVLEIGSKEPIHMETVAVFKTPDDPITLAKFRNERGIDWESANLKMSLCTKQIEGFYVSQSRAHKKPFICLVVEDTRPNHFVIYRPNTGKQVRLEYRDEVLQRRKVGQFEAEKLWKEIYEFTQSSCTHKYL